MAKKQNSRTRFGGYAGTRQTKNLSRNSICSSMWLECQMQYFVLSPCCCQFNYDDHDADGEEDHDDGDHLCAYTRAPARESDVICDR